MNSKQYSVYIMTNKANSVLYTGVTNNLIKRVYEHKNKVVPGFTSKYNLNKLVYYELCEDAYSAITREKQIKNWHRAWKINLINANNPNFIDLYNTLL